MYCRFVALKKPGTFYMCLPRKDTLHEGRYYVKFQQKNPPERSNYNEVLLQRTSLYGDLRYIHDQKRCKIAKRKCSNLR